MPFIEIMPLSYYIANNDYTSIEILNKHNIVIKIPENNRNNDDFNDNNNEIFITNDDINELLDIFFE